MAWTTSSLAAMTPTLFCAATVAPPLIVAETVPRLTLVRTDPAAPSGPFDTCTPMPMTLIVAAAVLDRLKSETVSVPPSTSVPAR